MTTPNAGLPQQIYLILVPMKYRRVGGRTPLPSELSSLKGRGVVKDVLSCFDLGVDSAEPTPVSRWSARSAARTNDLDDGAERFSACSVGVEAVRACYVVVVQRLHS